MIAGNQAQFQAARVINASVLHRGHRICWYTTGEIFDLGEKIACGYDRSASASQSISSFVSSDISRNRFSTSA